jgi:PHP family Zn ribbon phosphoesterase
MVSSIDKGGRWAFLKTSKILCGDTWTSNATKLGNECQVLRALECGELGSVDSDMVHFAHYREGYCAIAPSEGCELTLEEYDIFHLPRPN